MVREIQWLCGGVIGETFSGKRIIELIEANFSSNIKEISGGIIHLITLHTHKCKICQLKSWPRHK